MKENNKIIELMNRTFNGPAWHGPAVQEVLKDINYKTASAEKINNAHNIWDIVLHMSVWKDAAARFLMGQDVMISDERDWYKSPDYDENGWEIIKVALQSTHERLIEEIDKFPEERLNELVPRKDFTFYVLLHGVIQHDVYHAGQIALLKK